MGKVSTQFTLSLDGFIAGPNDDIGRLFGWYRSGDTDFTPPGGNMVFRVSRASADYLRREWGAIGAILTGRHDFDVSDAYGGVSPLGVPMFIVTHQPPQEWLNKPSPFTFVTDGVERGLELAQAAAGDRTVSVGGTTIVQQLLKAGRIDEILIDLAPILLGAGTRLFDPLADPISLEKIETIDAPAVTHLRYRVVR